MSPVRSAPAGPPAGAVAPGRARRSGTPAGSLSREEARRVALRAQRLDGSPGRPGGPVTAGQVRSVVERIGVLQIDSVNVLTRAHLVPVFSRLGPYDVGLLDQAAGRAPRRIVEAWAHEASYVPVDTYPLLAWRRRAYRTQAWQSIREAPQRHPGLVEDVLAVVAQDGPLTGSQVQTLVTTGAVHGPAARRRRPPADAWGWNWSAAKSVLEYLFFTGRLSSAGRTAAFERRYDLIERVLPRRVLDRPTPDDADAVRGLVEVAARAHGIGTLRCLADYFRIPTALAAPAVGELVDAGVLAPVRVEGWSRPAYLHRDAAVPRRVHARALLSPFDPLVFERRRLEDLFGLRYRIEIYVPRAQRVHGYYVLPFLLGTQIAALVDLKADRTAGVLRVVAAHRLGGAPPDTADQLAAELASMAAWLGLGRVERSAQASWVSTVDVVATGMPPQGVGT